MKNTFHICALLVVCMWVSGAPAQTEPSALAASLPRLQRELAAVAELESTTEIRRATKRIVRRAESLLEAHPDSPDRIPVQAIVFEVQKLLFGMRQSEEHRDALVEAAGVLVQAPDEYADVRVEPDMMLLQIQLAAEDASPEASALAIARFADRYRGSSAEAQSLMMAASSAFDIGNQDLLAAFRNTLSKQFRDDPLVSAFMRERFGTRGETHFRGTFERADGTALTLPIGQVYVVCFWSVDTPLLKERIDEIKAMQVRYKNAFRVFSFNLDEFGDSGAGVLRRMGVDWTPMKLPGGVDHLSYLSVGGANRYAALVVTPHGLATRGGRGHLHKLYEAAVRSPRDLTLLRTLCVGEYLLSGTPIAKRSPLSSALDELQSCFPGPPLRYRLSPEAERANYEKALAICDAALATHAEAPGLWAVHNHRCIALLGLWRLSGELEYLTRALRSAESSLAMDAPSSASLIPRFTMATQQLLADDADAEQVLDGFIEAVGGEDALGLAHAAALMLSLDAHSRTAFMKHRDHLLTTHLLDRATWSVASFLLEPSSSSQLFERAIPGTVTPPESDLRRPLGVTWRRADGMDDGGEDLDLHALVFMEATQERSAVDLQKRVMAHLGKKASERPGRDLSVTALFQVSDTNQLAAATKRIQWAGDAGYVPASEWGGALRALGIVGADQRPSVFLVRPGGTLELALSGISPDSDRIELLSARFDRALRDYDLARADAALAAGDYAAYAARLETSFPLKSRRRGRHEPEWVAASKHRRKLIWAYMKAEDWAPALKAANANVSAQTGNHSPHENPDVTWCRTCHGYLLSMSIRVALLRELGRTADADAALEMIDVPECSKGKGADTLWAEVESYMKGRRERFRHLGDPNVYLRDVEKGMRAGRQNLYGFGITSDIAMRARIHEALGHADAAAADRRHAALRAWPFAPREFDPGHVHAASVERREQTRRFVDAGDWAQALGLVNANIELHESEALRCESMCKICSAQVQSFAYYARTLDGMGRKQEAESAHAMAELAKCPPGEDLETSKAFPINRMYGGGSGINRLNFIKGVMRGGNYANTKHRAYRMEFAGDLMLRAQALAGLGQMDAARENRKRATALAYPVGPGAVLGAEGLPVRYEDVLSVASGE